MKMQLVDRQTEFEGVESFVFKPEDELIWRPGQYLHYVLEHDNADDRGIDRWFTISAAPFEQNVCLTTRFTAENGSSFKKALKAMVVGDTLKAYDPEGDFLIDNKFNKHILIAGGIGVTPYRAMLMQIDHEIKSINSVLMYANHDDSFVFNKEFEKLQSKHERFDIQEFIGEKRILADNLQKYVQDNNCGFYISGPRKMVIAYAELLETLEVEKGRIKTDYFPGY
jgi:ferredoxin-NADP reductase